MSDVRDLKEMIENMLKYYESLLSDEVIEKKLENYITICKMQIKMCEFEECNHLWVSLPSEDEDEDRLLGCVKCGFTNSFIPKFDKVFDGLSEEEKASFEYMTTWAFYDIPSIHSDSWCDLELGMAIYKKIKAAHPEATDEQISDYLSNALYNMRTKDQSEKRKASRVKRLELRPNFNAWNSEFEKK